MNGRIDGLTDGWKVGQMDGWKDGWMNGHWMDRRTLDEWTD